MRGSCAPCLKAFASVKAPAGYPKPGNTEMKGAMVRFRVVREKGDISICKDTMEVPLWRETSGRSLGSHDAAELVGMMCHGNGCRHENIRLHAISYTTGWSSLTHNRVLHHALARPLHESKVQLVLKTHGPSERDLAEKMAD